jgi:hypothetical protein
MQDIIPLRIHHQDQIVSAKLGACIKKLILDANSLTFGSCVVNISQCIAFS